MNNTKHDYSALYVETAGWPFGYDYDSDMLAFALEAAQGEGKNADKVGLAISYLASRIEKTCNKFLAEGRPNWNRQVKNMRSGMIMVLKKLVRKFGWLNWDEAGLVSDFIDNLDFDESRMIFEKLQGYYTWKNRHLRYLFY